MKTNYTINDAPVHAPLGSLPQVTKFNAPIPPENQRSYTNYTPEEYARLCSTSKEK